jgi:tetratricopeptide (TPR) repeat protein
MGIKNIYTELGDAEGYFKYVAQTNPSRDVSAEARDSMAFAIAERAYMADNCSRSIELFEKYLHDFANGAFSIDASYYLGSCLARSGRLNEALAHLAVVLDTARNREGNSYAEPALLEAAQIAFKLESYAKAAEYYGRLQPIASTKTTRTEAYVGKFRADYLNANHEATIADVTALVDLENVPGNIIREAYFRRAKAYERLSDTAAAMLDYAIVARDVKTAEGSEATYRCIAQLFREGNFDKTEQEVFAFSKSGTPHQYWLAKSFIVLGDVYTQRNDAFQAKATYESILDGYKDDNDGVIGEVARKMQALLNAEQQKESAQQQPTATEELAVQ